MDMRIAMCADVLAIAWPLRSGQAILFLSIEVTAHSAEEPAQ